MGWSDELKVGDTVRVTVDFEDKVLDIYDGEVELKKSSWTVPADDPRVNLKKIKPALPTKPGAVIDIVGGGRAMCTVDGWQFTSGTIYTGNGVQELFDYEVILPG